MQNFYDFIKEHTYKELPSYMKDIAYNIEKQFTHNTNMPRILMISMPPRSLKTTISSVLFPAWVSKNFKNKNIGISSYSEKIAKINKNKTCDILDSFPTENNNRLFDFGVTESIQQSLNIFIIDDYFKDFQESFDVTYTIKVFSWFMEIFRYNINRNIFILIMSTSWGDTGLFSRILYHLRYYSLNALVDFINIPAIEDEKSFWSERYSIDGLKQIENQLDKDAFEKIYLGKFNIS